MRKLLIFLENVPVRMIYSHSILVIFSFKNWFLKSSSENMIWEKIHQDQFMPIALTEDLQAEIVDNKIYL